MTRDLYHDKEVIGRIRMRWTAFGRHSQVMNGKLPFSVERKVYGSCKSPVLPYNAETCRLTKGVQLKSRTTQRAITAQMLGVTLRDNKRAEWIKKQTPARDILVVLRKMKFAGQGM